jgi:hypothetical protein
MDSLQSKHKSVRAACLVVPGTKNMAPVRESIVALALSSLDRLLPPLFGPRRATLYELVFQSGEGILIMKSDRLWMFTFESPFGTFIRGSI